MSNNVWTYEKAKAEAAKYKSTKDFRTKSPLAYNAAVRMKWIKECVWLKKANHSWTYEEIKKIIQDNNIIYSVDLEHQFLNAYATAVRHKWLKKLGLKHKLHSPYTYKEAYKVAKRYKTVKDFRSDNEALYIRCTKNKWIDTFDWLARDTSCYAADKDCCYMYLNEDLKIVYVGRTIHPLTRYLDHKNGRNSKVKQYFNEYGVELPEPIYYMNGAKFPVNYGLMIEDKLVKWFKENRWTVLNKAKTGTRSGALGGARKKWTEARIRKAAEECNFDYTVFSQKYGRAYSVYIKKNYSIPFIQRKRPNKYWNSKENCIEAASKCKNRAQFSKKYSQAYKISKDNGWLYEFFGKKEKG